MAGRGGCGAITLGGAAMPPLLLPGHPAVPDHDEIAIMAAASRAAQPLAPCRHRQLRVEARDQGVDVGPVQAFVDQQTSRTPARSAVPSVIGPVSLSKRRRFMVQSLASGAITLAGIAENHMLHTSEARAMLKSTNLR